MLKGLKVKGAVKAPDVGKPADAKALSGVMKAPAVLQRDDWMTGGGGSSRKVVEPTVMVHEEEKAPVKKAVDLAAIQVVELARVGDGGSNWRRRMDRRARERYEAEADGQELPERVQTVQERHLARDNDRSKGFIDKQRGGGLDRPRDDLARNAERKKGGKAVDHHMVTNIIEPQSTVDLNHMAARALRMKLANDIAGHDRLQAEIAAIRAAPRVQILPDIDAQGRPVNLAARPDSLASLVQQERLQTRSEYHLESAMTIMRDKKYSASTDDQFDAADVSNFDPKKRKAVDDHDRDLKKMISEHHRAKKENANCWFCLDGDRVQRHLIVSIGTYCYVQMVAGPPLGLGHCLIVPSDHVVSSTAMDEQVYEEIQLAKSLLARMFREAGQSVLFMETCSPSGKRHAFIECIPLDHEAYADAPIYFKKGIMECDEEWSSHKKLIETNRGKSIRSSIPSGFPYFHVQFGDDMSGFAHVIEDERKFKSNFGKEIICGLIDEPAEIILRAKSEPRQHQIERVNHFKSMWRPFDWTKQPAH